jgi:hypothetical protein
MISMISERWLIFSIFWQICYKWWRTCQHDSQLATLMIWCNTLYSIGWDSSAHPYLYVSLFASLCTQVKISSFLRRKSLLSNFGSVSSALFVCKVAKVSVTPEKKQKEQQICQKKRKFYIPGPVHHRKRLFHHHRFSPKYNFSSSQLCINSFSSLVTSRVAI